MSSISYFQPISDQQLYDFFAEFGGTKESVANDVESLKEWLKKTSYLPNIDDDEFLRNFLLMCKNSLEKTKITLEHYFIAKTLISEVYQNPDSYLDELKSTFGNLTVVPCRKLTPNGYRVFIVNVFGKMEHEISIVENALKAMQLCIDIKLKLDPVRGTIVICNMKDFTTTLIAAFMPKMKSLITLATKTTSHRICKIYVTNTAPFMDWAIALGKSFLSKKLRERLVVRNGEATNLTDVLPKEVLPSDFGGDETSLAELKGQISSSNIAIEDLWYEELKKHREWLIANENHRADLDKKPKDCSGNDDDLQYGVDGSFRKLCVD